MRRVIRAVWIVIDDVGVARAAVDADDANGFGAGGREGAGARVSTLERRRHRGDVLDGTDDDGLLYRDGVTGFVARDDSIARGEGFIADATFGGGPRVVGVADASVDEGGVGERPGDAGGCGTHGDGQGVGVRAWVPRIDAKGVREGGFTHHGDARTKIDVTLERGAGVVFARHGAVDIRVPRTPVPAIATVRRGEGAIAVTVTSTGPGRTGVVRARGHASIRSGDGDDGESRAGEFQFARGDVHRAHLVVTRRHLFTVIVHVERVISSHASEFWQTDKETRLLLHRRRRVRRRDEDDASLIRRVRAEISKQSVRRAQPLRQGHALPTTRPGIVTQRLQTRVETIARVLLKRNVTRVRVAHVRIARTG